MIVQRVTLGALAVVAAGAVYAGVQPIPEFTGDAFEGFESIMAPGPHSGPMPLFAGTATMDDEFTDPWVVQSLAGVDHELFPHNGNLMGLTPTGWAVFEFVDPVLRFGGYFGIANPASGGNVSFFDDEGGLIQTLSFDLPVGEWTWRGWESDVPVSRIVVHTGANPGSTTAYDDLRLAYVPEPASVAMLVVGAACVLRRRRGTRKD